MVFFKYYFLWFWFFFYFLKRWLHYPITASKFVNPIIFIVYWRLYQYDCCFSHFLESFYLSCSFPSNLPICFTSKNSFQLPLLTEELSICKSFKLFAINWILPKSDNKVRKYLQQDCVIFTNLFLCYTFEWIYVNLITLHTYRMVICL